MNAGTTFHGKSGNIVGTHQKIDRIARRNLASIVGKETWFPNITSILYFEGNNGPDGIKRKSPSKDEPWHYLNPANLTDRGLLDMISDHIANLARALSSSNQERAAFEAAWLAHSVVDGLTPAHHYPLGDKIEELFGMPHYERLTIKDKNVIKGSNHRDTISKNWEYWGFGGIFTTHFTFEFGISALIYGRSFTSSVPSLDQINNLKKNGFEKIFMQTFHDIVDLDLYELYTNRGWTRGLNRDIVTLLIPKIMNMVTLSWYEAIQQAKV
jgi:hypothetical protein